MQFTGVKPKYIEAANRGYFYKGFIPWNWIESNFTIKAVYKLIFHT